MNEPNSSNSGVSTSIRPDYGQSPRRLLPAGGRRAAIVAAFVLVGAAVAIAFWAQGRGYKTRVLHRLFPDDPRYLKSPEIRLISPEHRQTGVMPDAYVRIEFTKPNGKGVDPASLPDGVMLLKGNARERVKARVNTDAVGSVIVLRPEEPLELNALYMVDVLPAVRDTSGAAFTRFTTSFATAAGHRYEDYPVAGVKTPQSASTGKMCTGLRFGPDGRLYASTGLGEILRFDVSADGTLGTPQVFRAVLANNGGPRLCTGVTIDPASTPENVTLYVAHSPFPFDLTPPSSDNTSRTGGTPHGMSKKDIPDFSGKISRLSGANFERYEDLVTGLPRARHDHATGQMTFGPDGALYFGQASNTAMGDPDQEWAFRPERLLSASILRLDLAKLTGRSLPLNVQTANGGNYDPFAPDAPLTLYATGTRNCYAVYFHSSGRLYATLNGSAAGGNTPGTPADGRSPARRAVDGAYDGPFVPALRTVGTQSDYLLRIERGGYYGHPNALRAEFVQNGGNPTAGKDLAEVVEYPVGVQPDRNWRRPVFDFNKNQSPCGLIEYAGDAFPQLKDKLIAVRFSAGDDLIVLTPDPSTGDIAEAVTGIDGFGNFFDPLDVAVSPTTGFLYVTEYTGKQITLIRPVENGVSRKAIRQTRDDGVPKVSPRLPMATTPQGS